MAVGTWDNPYGSELGGGETLVFPRSKPYGANSTSAQDAISKDKTNGTEVVDYLKITIYDPKEGNNSSYNNSKKNLANNDKVKRSIYLYLPNKLREGYQAKYNGVKLGPLGVGAVGAASEAIAAGGIGDSFKDTIAKMAESGKSVAGYGIGADVINKVLKFGGGGNIGANELAALTTGRVFNPYEETIFQGVEFRDHKFDFLFAPKNSSDVETVVSIIEAFRVAMLPGKDDSMWLTIPDYFRIEIVRLVSNEEEETLYPQSGNSTNKGVLQKLMQFPSKMVLTNMDVDLSPYGPYTSLKTNDPKNNSYDFGPVAYNMSLSFKETSLLTRQSYGYDTRGEKS